MPSKFCEVKLFGAPRCNLAESPRWAEEHWWWVDAEKGIVYWRPGGAIDELEKDGMVQFPEIIGAVVPVINLEGFKPGELRIDGPTLASIFLGDIFSSIFNLHSFFSSFM